MEDINEIHDSLIEFISRGPALILEMAERIEKDTLQTQTIVDYFVGKGEINKTTRKFGSSPIYFMEKDRNKALDMLMQTLNNQEKALVLKIRQNKVINMDSLAPAERYISQNLGDFMKKVSAQDNQTGQKAEYVYEQELSLDDVKKLINGKEEREKPKEITVSSKKHEKKKTQDTHYDEQLKQNGFEVLEETEKDVFLCGYGPRNIKVVVQILNKKSINKKDFINAMGYSTLYKTITFIITNADKISGNKGFGSMVNIIKVEL